MVKPIVKDVMFLGQKSEPATRYKEIEVEYQDVNFKRQKQKFSGYVAQIICHEVDHILGIVI